MFNPKRAVLACAVAACLFPVASIAQEAPLFLTDVSSDSVHAIAENYLRGAGAARFGLTPPDLELVLDEVSYQSTHTGVRHVYFNQFVNGVPVYRGVAQVNVMPDGRVLNASSQFQADALQRANTPVPVLSAEDALRAAAQDIGLTAFQPTALPPRAGDDRQVFAGGRLSAEDIRARLVYEPHEGQLRLAWQFVVDRFERESKLLDLRYDAVTGELLGSDNYVYELDGKHPGHAHTGVKAAGHSVVYRVSPLGQESPAHPGVGHTQVTDPHVENASPFGWHDTRSNPPAGQPEYLVTRGNNVRAQWDLVGNNIHNDTARPLGVWDAATSTLRFDFPWNQAEAPDTPTNRVAATVNLFYWNNIIHDVLYQYGFDEPSGNFQFNNYGRGGAQNDGVIADALDGSMSTPPSVNNAYFSTPVDGISGRMQMFRWTSPGGLVVTVPESSTHVVPVPGWGWGTLTERSGDLVVVNSPAGAGGGIEGCLTPYTNAAEISGKIAVVRRGTCEFGQKALNAQNAGATGVIILNTQDGAPTSMAEGASGGSVTIPVMGLFNYPDGSQLLDLINQGSVTATLKKKLYADRDSDFDAGIIAHEYGHGVSNRLTGAPNQNCLGGEEQQGEGWSDFFALMFTMTDEVCSVPRGVGTYPSFQPVTGPGIRPYPYTPDMDINPFTFASIAEPGLSVPHGVGAVWNTMLWDMSCKLMDRYGYEPDIYSRGGGNGMAMQLVIDGLKLQGCSPQFVSSRNAILAADAALAAVPDTDYLSNRCIIWHAFARRGVGATASSGTAASRFDQVVDFSIPANCESFTVEASAGTGGEIATAGSQTALFQDVLEFQITPDTGYRIASVQGCEGTLIGGQFVTAPIVRDCTVTATFAIDRFEISTVVSAGGVISPEGPFDADLGSQPSIVLTPDDGHGIEAVTGCGGVLVDDTYTLAPVTADCTVEVDFTLLPPEIFSDGFESDD